MRYSIEQIASRKPIGERGKHRQAQKIAPMVMAIWRTRGIAFSERSDDSVRKSCISTNTKAGKIAIAVAMIRFLPSIGGLRARATILAAHCPNRNHRCGR
jgi:hypothetical protein